MSTSRTWLAIVRLLHPMLRISGQVYLWLAVLIFGASSAVTRKLTEIGAQNFVGGQNPISLCNVLFVGNLCALLVLLGIYRQQWWQLRANTFSRQEWFSLVTVATLAGALAPGLIFQALALTSVSNVVLIGRLEPPLTLALSIWLLRDRATRWQISGALIALGGVILTIWLQPTRSPAMVSQLPIGLGELLAVLGAIALSIATILGKQHLGRVPLGIYSLIRTGLGTIIFFVVALILYGHDHFANAFTPFLWKWMLLYGGLIVVVGQSFWLAGLRASSVATAAVVGSFTPMIGIVAAYWILHEVPNQAQYIGASVILVGLIVSQIGMHRHLAQWLTRMQPDSLQAKQVIESGMGFRGV